MTSKEYYEKNKEKWSAYYKARRQRKPLYSTWHSMLVRTGIRVGAKDHDRRIYIDREISICDSWLNYREFESWALAHGWKEGLQIDRIDNDKGYDPSNCRFVTPKENSRNRRNCHKIQIGDKQVKFIELYEEYDGVKPPYKIAEGRLKLGWDWVRAITTPVINKPQGRNP